MPHKRSSYEIRPLSEFRAHAAGFIEQAHQTRRPSILTQDGHNAAVLLDIGEYERLVERAELLDDISTAEAQLARGEGVEHSDLADSTHLLRSPKNAERLLAALMRARGRSRE